MTIIGEVDISATELRSSVLVLMKKTLNFFAEAASSKSSSTEQIDQQHQAYTPLLHNLPYRNSYNNPSKRSSIQ